MSLSLVPVLTPHGALRLDPGEDDFVLERALAERLRGRFERGARAMGCCNSARARRGAPCLPRWRGGVISPRAGWPNSARRARRSIRPRRGNSPPPAMSELGALIDEAPPMTGGEYLRPEVLGRFWREMGEAFAIELSEESVSLADFLKSRDSRRRSVGRVHFNLAENRRDPEYPFAFMATYTSGLAANGALRHLPLAQALRESAGDNAQLLRLLDPVSRASETCAWLKAIVDAGEIFHPLRWTPRDALQFLRDVEPMERAGLAIRMPANWRMGRPSRPRVQATVGSASPSVLGMDALLDFHVGVTLDGESLTAEEIETLLKATHGLALLRGKWVEVDSERLASTIDKFQAIERLSESGGGSVRRRDASARGRLDRCRTTPTRQPRNGRMSRRARGWRRRSMAAAVPKGSRASIPATVSRRRCGLIKRRGCAGCICSRNSASAPASPTTWGSARRSRSWRCFRPSPPRRRRRRACWWRPLRCSPTGRWRRPGSRRA